MSFVKYTENITHKDVLELFDTESEGVYRKHKYEMTKGQKSWYQQLIQSEYIALLTIKLPHEQKSGYIRTKNQYDAKNSYHKIIRHIEMAFAGSKHHWKRNPLCFIGVFEHGKEDYWHVHLAIKPCDTPVNMLVRLINSVKTVRKHFGFSDNVINLKFVHDKKGICAYLVKELKTGTNSRYVRYIKDEGAYLFNLQTWFDAADKNKYPYTPDSFTLLKLWIGLGAILKRNKELIIANPINKLKNPRYGRC